MDKIKQNLFEILGEVIFISINRSRWCVDSYGRTYQELNKFPEAYQIFNETDLQSYHSPYIYLHSMGNSYALEKIKLPIHLVDYCNANGLEIYFSELLTLSVGEKFDFYPISQHNVDTLDQKIIFEWEDTFNNRIHCFEFESVQKFINNNNLNNVKCCVGIKDNKGVLKSVYPDIDFVYKDIFLQSIVRQLIKYKTPSNKTAAETIEYNFWCGNLRYMTYRHLVSAYLTNYNSKISFGHRGSLTQLKSLLWFDLDKWKQSHSADYEKIANGVKSLNQHPRYIDKIFTEIPNITGTVIDYINYPEYEQDPHIPIYYTHALPELYDKTFCAVVNESIFAQPVSTVSEKPLNAIQNYKPFVFVGPPNSLKILKQMGFKTFEDFWDESYDQETNHEKRLIKILKLLDTIGNMSINQCRKMYEEMLPILEHNYNNINQNLFDKILHLS